MTISYLELIDGVNLTPCLLGFSGQLPGGHGSFKDLCLKCSSCTSRAAWGLVMRHTVYR